jgi:hypothetical protein
MIMAWQSVPPSIFRNRYMTGCAIVRSLIVDAIE